MLQMYFVAKLNGFLVPLQDHLFHGCHALYGDEYRLIREKLLPGWLMVVQLFVTLALMASYFGQFIIVCLLLRFPLEWILRFEWHFCALALVCKVATGNVTSKELIKKYFLCINLKRKFVLFQNVKL